MLEGMIAAEVCYRHTGVSNTITPSFKAGEEVGNEGSTLKFQMLQQLHNITLL